MKIYASIILIICLFYISPLSADYSRMINTLENYTPPEYYTDSLEQNSEDNIIVSKPDAISNYDLFWIKDIR